jgi:hypothetical protein
MVKPLLAIITLLIFTTECSFKIKTAKCLLRILLKNIENVEATSDNEIMHLKKVLDDSDNEEIKIFNDVKIISDLNNFLLNYDYLNSNLKNELNLCEIDSNKVLERCQNDYKECYKINILSYGVYCNNDETQNQNFLCYRKCPEGFSDDGASCKKPTGTFLTVYNSKRICEEATGNKCDSYMDDSFATPECPKYHKKLLKTICVPQCEDGLLDDGESCWKRKVNHLPNPYYFNFNDLFD